MKAFSCSPGAACTEPCWHPAARSRACVCLCRGAELHHGLLPVQFNSGAEAGGLSKDDFQSTVYADLPCGFALLVQHRVSWWCSVYHSVTKSAAITLVLETRASSWPWSAAALMYEMDK